MASASDIITYIGVPLAVLGVLPMIYTALRTLYTRQRLLIILPRYEIEPKVNSRLVSGTLDVGAPMFELKVLKREDPKYWTPSSASGDVQKEADERGASWRGMHWEKQVVERTTLKLHFSDKLVLPSARIEFRKLVRHLGDLGCQTCPEAFYNLNKFRKLIQEHVCFNRRGPVAL